MSSTKTTKIIYEVDIFADNNWKILDNPTNYPRFKQLGIPVRITTIVTEHIMVNYAI